MPQKSERQGLPERTANHPFRDSTRALPAHFGWDCWLAEANPRIVRMAMLPERDDAPWSLRVESESGPSDNDLDGCHSHRAADRFL